MKWRENPDDRQIAKLLKRSKNERDLETARKCREKICIGYWARIHRLAQSWLFKFSSSGIIYPDPDDATQDILLEVYKDIHTYDESKRFDTWVITVGINYLKDTIGKIIKELKRRSSQQEERGISIRDEKETIEAQITVTQLHDFFKSQGSETLFYILVFHYLHGFSDRQIAYFIGELPPDEEDEKEIKNADERVRRWREDAKKLVFQFVESKKAPIVIKDY